MVRYLLFALALLLGTGTGAAAQSLALRPDIPADSVKLILHFTEESPRFAGNLLEFLNQNLRFPDEVREDTTIKTSLSETVQIQFVVCEDGDICNVHIEQGSSYPALNREALRVLRLMPAWKPGKNKGKPVKVFYTLPIHFELE